MPRFSEPSADGGWIFDGRASTIHHNLEGLPSVYFLDLSLSLIQILNGNYIAHIRFDGLNMNDFIGVRNYNRMSIFLCYYGGWNVFF